MWQDLGMKNTHTKQNVRDEFFAPVASALQRSEFSYKCPKYTDRLYLESGVGRSIKNVISGREWIQHVLMKLGIKITVSNSFAVFKSSRRLNFLSGIAKDVRTQADKLISQGGDPLSQYSELSGFAIYASDGHTHKASAHEQEIYGKKRPVTHIYSLNLRMQTLIPLVLAEPGANRKKEHELTALKRIGVQALRMGEKTGTKVIHVYDPAIVDYTQWYKWKKGSGVYILTLEKSNSALITVGINDWDRDDTRNIGVICDELVGPSNGHIMRRVTYQDPLTGKTFRFITNELTIPPGLIAFLYKLRWNVEKTFDEIKNKFFERKAWGNSNGAKIQQANFIALAYNLMRILETKLKRDEGIIDHAVAAKRKKRLKKEKEETIVAGRRANALVLAWHRSSQRSLQFIRWLRYCIENSTSWGPAIKLLRPLMAEYLH